MMEKLTSIDFASCLNSKQIIVCGLSDKQVMKKLGIIYLLYKDDDESVSCDFRGRTEGDRVINDFRK